MARGQGLTTTVMLSGGIDSAACLSFYLREGASLSALFVRYGQPAAADETRAARRVADYYGVALTELSFRGARRLRAGYVPHRNALLIQCGLLQIGTGPGTIGIGVHRGSSYPDCTPEFMQAAQRLADVTARGAVAIEAPFLDWTKSALLEFCDRFDVPVDLTWSCENRGPTPCRRCASCLDRDMIGV